MTLAWRSPTSPKSHQWAFKQWRRGMLVRQGEDWVPGDGELHKSALAEIPLGGGKTLTAIEEMLELVLAHVPNAQILVLCRHANRRTVWGEQLPQHAPGLPFTILDTPRKQRLKLLQEAPIDQPMVWIHSHEDLPGFGNELAKYHWDMMVIDECAAFRTAGAARTMLLTRPNLTNVLRLDGDVRLAMSGMPMVKHPLDLYPILRWLGAWKGNKQEFTDRFLMEIVDRGVPKLIVKDEPALLALLATVRFQVPRSAVHSMPRTWRYDRLAMPKWQRDDYRRIQRDLRTRYTDADGSVIESEIRSRLSELLRLHQVAAGFEAIDSERWVWHNDNAKTRHLIDVVMPELDGERAIIWCVFQAEAMNVARMLRDAGHDSVEFHGGLTERENQAGYERWKRDPSVQCFVSTLAKGSLGLNLPEASATVYHSRTFNTEHVAQSLERNVRITSTHESVRVIVIEAEGTVDQHVSRIVGDDFRRAAALTSLDLKAVLGE